jgi:hypothetical protein
MANISSAPVPLDAAISCVQYGFRPVLDRDLCCFANNQTSSGCSGFFGESGGILQAACPSGNCIADCGKPALVYSLETADTHIYDQRVSIQRYWACANLPSIANYKSKGVLNDKLSRIAGDYIPPDYTNLSIEVVSSVVTDCLSSSCRNSRRRDLCYDTHCSPIKLLSEDRIPNITAINSCLYRLCTSGLNALPFADADVVGIGVSSPTVLVPTSIRECANIRWQIFRRFSPPIFSNSSSWPASGSLLLSLPGGIAIYRMRKRPLDGRTRIAGSTTTKTGLAFYKISTKRNATLWGLLCLLHSPILSDLLTS